MSRLRTTPLIPGASVALLRELKEHAALVNLLASAVDGKQTTLVSGANIKTVNGNSLLGSGDLAVGGGLTNFTESVNTAAPNNVGIPVVVLAAVGATSSVDFCLLPKGTGGALLADIPDNMVAGGNKRGANAVDLQMGRSSADRVASGTYSVVMGYNNKASANYATSFGTDNQSTGTASFSAGSLNTASGAYGFVGGYGCQAVGNIAVALGYQNLAGGDYAIALGAQATTRGVIGAFAWTSNSLAVGRTQTERFVLRAVTTNNTPAAASTNGGALTTNNGVVLPDNASYYCRIRVLARNTANGDSKSWTCTALIRRGTGAASTVMIGAPVIASDFGDASLSAAAVALTANTAVGALDVTVTGIAATNIHWAAHAETLEVTN